MNEWAGAQSDDSFISEINNGQYMKQRHQVNWFLVDFSVFWGMKMVISKLFTKPETTVPI